MPPAHQCVNDFDVHVVVDPAVTPSSVRIGGTDTLNTQAGLSQGFYFHPTTSPFHVTVAHTAYVNVVSSNPIECNLDVSYDVKFDPVSDGVRTFRTGAMTITAPAGCVQGMCINFEFYEGIYDTNGNCRITFSDQCAA
jgi:Flp pilus assembly protein TadG